MGKSSGEDAQLQASQANLADMMTASGKQSAEEGSTLFNLALPGLEKSESYYNKLASGDPNALARANAPAIQSITGQSNQQLQNIMQNAPRGGARDLAISDADLSKGAQISNLTTGSYTGAFSSLASLGGQNVSQGNQATETGLRGMNSASNQYGQIQQISNEQKATQMGLWGSVGGSLLEAGGEACWIAMAYWGDFDERTLLVRRWLNRVYAKTFVGSAVMWMYREYGQRVARQFKRNAAVRFVLKPLFDWFLSQAKKSKGAPYGC